MQTRRPCQISRCGKTFQYSRGTSLTRSRSILTGSSCRVRPSRCESRRTCVSTTIPSAWPRSAMTTFAVLRATPGSRSSSSIVPRHLAVVVLEQHRHRPAQRLRLLAEEAGRADVVLELLRRDGEVVLRRAVLLEQPLGDAVDVHVGRLRREHHRDEQLQVVAEGERDRRVRVLGQQPLDDRPDPLALRADAAARFADVAAGHQPRSFGPAQTRSSAGQSRQTNSSGVGRNSFAWIRAIASDSSASSAGTSSTR